MLNLTQLINSRSPSTAGHFHTHNRQKSIQCILHVLPATKPTAKKHGLSEQILTMPHDTDWYTSDGLYTANQMEVEGKQEMEEGMDRGEGK